MPFKTSPSWSSWKERKSLISTTFYEKHNILHANIFNSVQSRPLFWSFGTSWGLYYNGGTIFGTSFQTVITSLTKDTYSPHPSQEGFGKVTQIYQNPTQKFKCGESQSLGWISSSLWLTGVLNLDDFLKDSLGFRLAVTPCDTGE